MRRKAWKWQKNNKKRKKKEGEGYVINMVNILQRYMYNKYLMIINGVLRNLELTIAL